MLSRFVNGIHDEGDPALFNRTGGTILLPRAVGHDPNDMGGIGDISPWDGLTVAVRIQHAWGTHGGCIAPERFMGDFVRRVGNYAKASPGVHVWIIGNEPNVDWERPEGFPILPRFYAETVQACAGAIRANPGHIDDIVIPGPTGPWNNQTFYETNPRGDWVQYLQDVYLFLQEWGFDIQATAIHTYTHGASPRLVYVDRPMDPPFEDRQFEFRAFEDYARMFVRIGLGDVPMLITETDQNEPWVANGWINEAYTFVEAWNLAERKPTIGSLILYRWDHDKFEIVRKPDVIEEIRSVFSRGITWKKGDQEMPEEWKTVYGTSFDPPEGWVYQNGISELEVPGDGWVAEWYEDPAEGKFDRPEIKPKIRDGQTNQPEVRTEPRSLSIGTAFASHRACVRKRLVGVKAGQQIRAFCWVMGVSHHNDGSIGGGLGQVLGVVADGEDFLSGSYGSWYSSDDSSWAERTWVQIHYEGPAPSDNPWIVLRSDAREAYEAQYSHYDDLSVEVLGESSPGPGPGPSPGGTLYDHIDAVRAALEEVDDRLRELEDFVVSGSRTCLLVE